MEEPQRSTGQASNLVGKRSQEIIRAGKMVLARLMDSIDLAPN